jgi:hypothetical protein
LCSRHKLQLGILVLVALEDFFVFAHWHDIWPSGPFFIPINCQCTVTESCAAVVPHPALCRHGAEPHVLPFVFSTWHWQVVGLSRHRGSPDTAVLIDADRADVWSLGVTMLVALTGTRPWGFADRADGRFVTWASEWRAAREEALAVPQAAQPPPRRRKWW